MAKPTPYAELDPDAAWHPDADTAASHAVKGIGTGKEHAGVIYRDKDGRYSYSKPIDGENDSFSLQAKVRPGHTIAGIYHNHPGTDNLGQVFSPNDIDVANQLKVPSYVLFEKDGSIRKYQPGKTATRSMAMPGSRNRQLTVADGDKIQVAEDPPAAPVVAVAQVTPGPVITGQQLTTTVGEAKSMADPTSSSTGTQTPSLNTLYTQNPGTVNATAAQAAAPTPVTAAQAKTPDSVTSQNATAGTANQGVLAQGQQYSAAQNTVDPRQLASNQLKDITSEDSPLMQQAKQQGLNTANSRGLLNSTLAGGAAESEMVKAATPLAEQNAATEANSSLANQAATNAASAQNAQLGTQASTTNAQIQAQISQLNAQMQTAVSQGNAQQANDIAKQLQTLQAQTSQFNTGQTNQLAAQQQQLETQTGQFNAAQSTAVSQQNAQETNAMTSQVLQANSDLNKQFLAGTQSMDLATIQGRYQNLISQNSAAASLYNSYMNSIAATMANTNLDPSRAAQIVQLQQNTLASGLQLMDDMNNLDPATGQSVNPGNAGTQSTGGVLSQGATTSGYTPTTQNPQSAAGNIQHPSTAGGGAAVPNSDARTAALVGAGLGGAGAAFNSQGATTAGTAMSGLGGAANMAAGIERGGVIGGVQTATGAVQAAGAIGKFTGNPLPASITKGAGVLANAAGIYSGIQQGGAVGYTSAAANAAQLGSKVGAFGGASAGIGMAAGVVGAGLAVYNAISNWNSGATASNTMNGAQAGAAVGTMIVPGLGTVIGGVIGAAVGALSSLAGPGQKDAETKASDQLINYTSSHGNTPQAAQSVQNPYLMMAGLMDERHSDLPIYQKYGRAGEQQFTKDMTTQINDAVKAGTISTSSTPDQVFSQVVKPWMDKMGDWSKVGTTYATAAQGLVQNMVSQYVNGTAQANFKAVGGDQPFATTPAFGGGTSPLVVAAQKQKVVNAVTRDQQGGMTTAAAHK